MRILIACEESQRICIEFRKLGHEAFSCDILPPSGGHPEWHIQGDVLEQLDKGWDMMIAHPPCTYLTVTGNRWFKPEYADRYPTRAKDREDAVLFFMALANAPIERIAIENPVSIIASRWRKSDQVIQPWQFGDPHTKKTCLWLKNLPKLIPTKIVEPQYVEYNSSTKKSGKSRYPLLWSGKGKNMSVERSKTFPGIARAIAEQWGNLPKI